MPRMRRIIRLPTIKGRKLKAGERSLRWFRKRGWEVDKLEHYVTKVEGEGQQRQYHGGFRKDPFGFMDLLAYRGDETLAVQTTSRQQITAHLRKYRRDPAIRQKILDWITGEHRSLVVHGWECVEVPKVSGDGTKAEWQLTERLVNASDLDE